MKAKQMATDAMLIAICALLGYLSVDLGNLKVTFESIPILVAALMFGAVDGLAVGGLGTLIYQLLRYGVTITTPLWMLPYMLCGLFVGLFSQHHHFELTTGQTAILIILNEIMITLLNTGVMYIDSKIYGYYSFVYIFGTFVLRVVICVVKAVLYAVIIPKLIAAIPKKYRKA